MKINHKLIIFFIVICLSGLFYLFLFKKNSCQKNSIEDASIPIIRNKIIFIDNFDRHATIEETGSDISRSPDVNWALTSGGYFFIKNGISSTQLGRLKTDDPWSDLYEKNNPLDTDGGKYPQNLFRLVQKGRWFNYDQQIYFRIVKYNETGSPNRNSSNGIFLFNRYQDQDNIYYTGIRVDGSVVIKKKLNGKYYTIASRPIPDNEKNFNSEHSFVLPVDSWIGLKTEVVNDDSSNVQIRIYTDFKNKGEWSLLLEKSDDCSSYGGQCLNFPGQAGIRTDFMDVEFKDFKIKEL